MEFQPPAHRKDINKYATDLFTARTLTPTHCQASDLKGTISVGPGIACQVRGWRNDLLPCPGAASAKIAFRLSVDAHFCEYFDKLTKNTLKFCLIGIIIDVI
jgi:hypothetical protein